MRHPELEETYRNSPNLNAREGGYLLRFVPASVASAAKPLAATPMGVRVFLACLGFCAVCFAVGAYMGGKNSAATIAKTATELEQAKASQEAAQKLADQKQAEIVRIQQCVVGGK